ncbi:MAG: glycosyltransferase family 2 protein [Candidatus Omnitrophica bacterium]|nr:glycosyltransferase family 2 protein [Candidatus Omnitrophota bacterium]
MIDIILPIFNEEENISQVIKEIKNSIKKEFQILVVDDCSSDNSAKVARDSGALVISHPYRMGNGASVKTGIRVAKADILVFMDGDGQHNPADIARILEYIDKYDMVVGARSKDSHAPARRTANIIYNWFASYVTRFKIQDLTSGFRVIRKDLALKFLYLLPNGFSYPTTLTLAILRSGRSIKYVPITALARKGKSKIKPLSDGIRFLLIIAKIATVFSPFRVFLPISFLLFFLGMGNYLYTFISFHSFTNMSALLFTSSITIFMLGLISEQIAQLRLDRTENNP